MLGTIFELIGRHFVACWAPFQSKKCRRKNVKFRVTRHWLQLANQWSKWLDSFRDSTLTRPSHDSDSDSTLTRGACDSDSTKMPRTHHWSYLWDSPQNANNELFYKIITVTLSQTRSCPHKIKRLIKERLNKGTCVVNLWHQISKYYVSFSSQTNCNSCKRQCSFILPILCYQGYAKRLPLSSNLSNTKQHERNSPVRTYSLVVRTSSNYQLKPICSKKNCCSCV